MKRPIIKSIVFGVIMAVASCTDLDPTWYSEVTPETFFKTRNDVYSAMGRPFTHLYTSEMRTDGLGFWFLEELTADTFVICQKELKWQNGNWLQFQNHNWGSVNPFVNGVWNLVNTGVSLSLEVIEDLKAADYVKVGFTEDDRVEHIAQMKTLIAYFYMRGLGFYGGMPIYEATAGAEPRPRSSAKETWLYIGDLLKESLKTLPLKNPDTEIDFTINRGVAAILLARLYFNAAVTVGEDRFSECAEVCEDILSGKYGSYAMASDWREPFGFDNLNCPENIWVLPSALNKLENNAYTAWFYQPNMMDNFFGINGAGSMNALSIQPSLRPNGTPYTDSDFRLGRIFSKIHDSDLRKKCYRYDGNGDYEGMFVFGAVEKNGVPVIVSGQTSVHDGSQLVLVDYVGRTSLVGTSYPALDDVPSTKYDGEENSGVRLVKYPIAPDHDHHQWTAGYVLARLAEVQYMLAECKWRSGDAAGAASLINDVRRRNFENGDDPDPCSTANLDEWRMLDEWAVEFLGETRRRTDLLRWNRFVEADWWDHKASNSPHLKLFPVPNDAISGNPLIEPNPGYGQ